MCNYRDGSKTGNKRCRNHRGRQYGTQQINTGNEQGNTELTGITTPQFSKYLAMSEPARKRVSRVGAERPIQKYRNGKTTENTAHHRMVIH